MLVIRTGIASRSSHAPHRPGDIVPHCETPVFLNGAARMPAAVAEPDRTSTGSGVIPERWPSRPPPRLNVNRALRPDLLSSLLDADHSGCPPFTRAVGAGGLLDRGERLRCQCGGRKPRHEAGCLRILRS